jgi:hypothetical protein|uniref:Uncharacterized protein n=1 Tax=Eutreptiella gymnastica TaxID=73025 RepID=A0A7S4GGE4_9EUGL|mmetsp:Transcript_37360/g.62196  ORF Transcript_37360/g.62196 Transcript_37360/m.62196 type:complete len:346 (-) Transcript_37360:918-1955(-)|eukprot:CAMPEP_0174287428 /NCGR_PEP_ID=MMETSP0809-20121228/16057_1 /TAXON_ID=73025 ORGANISM="Eutreptiella gymnastica-like, Strain CCMP1594" /NCGR_SAMPLE_ID=MMETSP0809 /ASSEMBLY_ACC=CAM_ASM_000658 /LENGTH=345 /DNA_ID=CAMNT_0015383987 /DNA_START=104 /DNA_END=1141 /DNA_ORIENTATION=+
MPFANIDTAFLKDEIGPILAKGLAETVIACPSDPVEYLAIWLLHHLHMQELEDKKLVAIEKEEKAREEWTKSRQKKQAEATHVIQREWKHFVKAEEDRKFREKKLLEQVQDKERELEESDEYREENIQIDETEGMSELEREKGLEKARAALHFKKAQAMVQKLDKSNIAEFKQMKKVSTNIFKVVKCCFYFFGSKPKEVKHWMQIRAAIKPALFLEKALAFEPIGPKKKRLCTRVRRILRGVNDEQVRSESVAVFLLYQWCLTAVELRALHDEEVKLKKELGKEVEEEEEDEEDPENVDEADKDPDEEEQKLIEEEEKARLAEEEAKWKAEHGDEDDDKGDEDEG